MKLLQYLRCSIILAAMNPIALMAQISTQGGVVVVDDNFNAIGLPIGPGDTDVRPYNIFLNSNSFQGEAVLSLENSQLVSKRLITMRDPSSPELNGSIVNIGAGSSIFTGYVTNPSCSPLDLASQGAAVMNINGLFASKPALTPQPPFSCSHGSVTNAAGSTGFVNIHGRSPNELAVFYLDSEESADGTAVPQFFQIGRASVTTGLSGEPFGSVGATSQAYLNMAYSQTVGTFFVVGSDIGSDGNTGTETALGHVIMNNYSIWYACTITIGLPISGQTDDPRIRGEVYARARDSYILNKGNCSNSVYNGIIVGPHGRISGNGRTNLPIVLSRGTVAPGNSPGEFTIENDLLVEEEGVIEIEVAPGGLTDKLIVTGETRVVSGKVLLKFLNGAGISAGEKIAFLDTTTLVGGENLEIEVEGLEEPFEAVLTPDGEITAITDGIPTTEPSLMDVRPGKPNNINIVSEQVFPVAILASRGGLLENISNLDISSLRFGPAEAPIDDKSPSFKDVNGDSLDDIVVWFRVSETGLSCDDSQVEIYGKTNDGQDFNATDFVQASGCNSPSSIPSLEDLAPPAPL